MLARAPAAVRLLRHRQPRCRRRSQLFCAAAAAARSEDVLLRSISVNGEVACIVACTTRLVSEAAALHKTAPTATAALGRALVSGLLLNGFRGEGETAQLSFKGGGPLGKLIVIADGSSCAVKGYVENPLADPPLRPDGKLNVGAAVGTAGVLSVMRLHPRLPPYTGSVELVSGEVAEDVGAYLQSSEQVSSAIGLGVSIGRDQGVLAAGGFLLQCLPFASDETLTTLEANLAGLKSMTQMLSDGLDAAAITELLLAGLGVSPGAQTRVPSYGPCDAADLETRMRRAVVALGKTELQTIYEQEGRLQVTCEFCKISLEFDYEAVMPVAKG